MNSKEYKKLLESYNAVYEQIGVKVPSGTSDTEALKGLIPKGDKVHEVPKKKSTLQNASYDPEGELVEEQEINEIFNYLLEYLVSEGYADTNEAALVIMANMSEEWKQNIVEVLGGQPGDGYIGHPRLGIKNSSAPPKKSTNIAPKNTGLAGKLGNRASELEGAINKLR